MVLVAGGGSPGEVASASAELFDPVSGSWRATAPMSVPRSAQTATLLANGKVLVAGGYSDFHALSSAELYDPITGDWTATGSMVEARGYHTATSLPDGKVLVTGGRSNNSSTGRPLPSAEVYDPATGRWTTTGSMNRARAFHSATLLGNGQVLVAGAGVAGVRVDIRVTAELYDPATGTWVSTGSMSSARANHTATLLPSGLVLVAGGFDSVDGSIDGLGVGAALASSELYDPATGSWRAAGEMGWPAVLSTATLLGDGDVLVVGGASVPTGGAAFGAGTSASSSAVGVTTAELFRAASERWTVTAGLAIPRQLHAAVVLNDGRVLVVGGSSLDFGWSSAELYAGSAP
jgi:N-acetylneuraminic acid mutarotase